MKRLLVSLSLLLPLFACDKPNAGGGGVPAASPAPKKPDGRVKEASVAQVAEWMNAKTALVLDANVQDFRMQNGTLPGAVLLQNYLDWDPPTVLGPDKARQLVFYCTSRT